MSADELAASEVLTETNEGTFGPQEARRKCGCGDPAFSNYRIYTRVGDGRERRVGADPEHAPGYPRRFRQALAEAQAELRRLRRA